jgi:hypothetical protein
MNSEIPFVINSDVFTKLATRPMTLELPEIHLSGKELARSFPPGSKCKRNENKARGIMQSRPLDEFNARQMAKGRWFCMVCSKSAAQNFNEAGKGTRTAPLRFFSDGLIIGNAVCRACFKYAKTMGRSGPLRNIRNEMQLLRLYFNYKNRIHGKEPEYPDCLPLDVIAPLQPPTNLEGFVEDLGRKVRRVHRRKEKRDKSPKRKTVQPPPMQAPVMQFKWSPEEYAGREAEIKNGPDIDDIGETKGNKLRMLRVEQFGLMGVMKPVEQPEEEEEPVERRESHRRETKAKAELQIRNLKLMDSIFEDRIAEQNKGWKEIPKKSEKSSIPEVDELPLKRETPAAVKCVLGILANPGSDTLRDISLWRDLIPEMRNCKPSDWQYFKNTHPEVWNIFCIVGKFRFLTLASASAIAIALYESCIDSLKRATPLEVWVPSEEFGEVRKAPELALLYVSRLFESDELVVLGNALATAIWKLCDPNEPPHRRVDEYYLCCQLQEIIAKQH